MGAGFVVGVGRVGGRRECAAVGRRGLVWATGGRGGDAPRAFPSPSEGGRRGGRGDDRRRGDSGDRSRGGGGERPRGGNGDRFTGRARRGAEGYERREKSDEPEELTELQLAMRSGRDMVFGANTVLAALQAGRRKDLGALWVADAAATRDKPEAKQILQLAEKLRLNIKKRNKGDLNALSDNRPHQGFVLEASPLQFEPINGLLPTDEAKVWLVLDEVTDPMNFGAVTRSALFMRCDGLVVAEKNCCPITPTASKASSGALELVPVYATRNLPNFLNASRENGWRVLGAHVHPNSVPIKSVELGQPTLVVMGSEGAGLRKNVLNCCDDYVQIGKSAVGTVDSLNVSVAAGILLHHFLG